MGRGASSGDCEAAEVVARVGQSRLMKSSAQFKQTSGQFVSVFVVVIVVPRRRRLNNKSEFEVFNKQDHDQRQAVGYTLQGLRRQELGEALRPLLVRR